MNSPWVLSAFSATFKMANHEVFRIGLALFVSERHQWIHLARTARGNISRKYRHRYEDERRDCNRRGIRSTKTVEESRQQSRGDHGALLVETVTPLALEVGLSVQQELQSRWDEADRLRRLQVDRARYECELARRRFLRVDPDNRLVASSLEAE